MSKFKKTLSRYIKRVVRVVVGGCLGYLFAQLLCFLLNLLDPGWLIIALMYILKVAMPLLSAFWALATQFYNEAVEDGELEEILSKTPPLFGKSTSNTPSAEEVTVSTVQSDKIKTQEYIDVELTVDEILTKVAGVSFSNSDGSSRQAILSRCESGDRIELEYYEYNDDPAYAVYTYWGQIGNLSAEDAWHLYNMPDNYSVSGVITKVTGGSSGRYYGCNIRLTVFETRHVPIKK